MKNHLVNFLYCQIYIKIIKLLIYHNKLIIYSHGNFIFDQEWSKETKTGIIIKHYFLDKKQVGFEVLPIYISDYSQPQFIEGLEKEKILNQLYTDSLGLMGPK